MLIFVQRCLMVRVFTLLRIFTLVVSGLLLVINPAYAQSADEAMCPVGFNQTAEDDTTITCRFERRFPQPAPPVDPIPDEDPDEFPDDGPSGGPDNDVPPGADSLFGSLERAQIRPQDTDEGRALLRQARADCVASPIDGRVTIEGDVSVNGVGVGVYLLCVVDKPERIEFDQVSSITQLPFEHEVATSLVNICTRLLENDAPNEAEADILQVCRDINAETDAAAQLDAIQNIAAKQFVDIGNLISFQNLIQVGDIGNRLASLRSALAQNTRDVANSSPVHPSRGLLAKSSSVKGGAAGDTNNKLDRFGVFVTGSAGDAEKDNTALSRGFDYSSSVLTLGIDYMLNDSTVVGLAYGYGSSDSSLSDRTGAIDMQTNNINLYGAKHFGNGWFADAIIGFGKIDTENRRFIKFTVNNVDTDQLARSQFDSDQTIVSLGFGKTINRVIDIDLAARFNYIDTSIERFAEATDQGNAGFGLALEIEGYDLKSSTSDVSASISKPFSRSWGVIVPKATVRWIHEFENGDDNLFGRFLVDTTSFDFTQSNIELGSGPSGSTIFRVPLEKIDSNYGNLLVGATALLPNQFSLNASASKTLGLSSFDHSYYSLTLRRDF